MTGTKRKQLTTDQLMRRQEETRKRRKPSPVDSKGSEEGEDSTGSGTDGIGSSEDGSEILEKGILEDDGDGNSQASEELEEPSDKTTLTWQENSDDIGTGSRISFKAKPSQPSHPPIHSTLKATTFASLGISSPLISAMLSMSIRAPTEIQAACIPPLLAGVDCIGNAKTGSGKTIAFALPILQKLSLDPYGIFALVLTPTRELAFQISDQFAVLGAPLNVRTAVVVGGMDMMAQAIELNNRPHVVVATPGRIVDHLRSSSAEWDFSRVKFLVLDEADRLLTSTFAEDLAHLFNALPRDRQTALFTATWTASIDGIAEAPPRLGKQKPFTHKITTMTETVETLKQHYILVPSHVREPYLYHLLRNLLPDVESLRRAALPERPRPGTKSRVKQKMKTTDVTGDIVVQPPPTMIFCARARTAAYLTNLLKTLDIRVTALHSRLTQRERLTSLQLFRSSVVSVLVCTDVGARGLDIEDVALVINWDLPNEPEEYTHRVGRTARAGRGGMAVSFVSEKDEERMSKIETRINMRLEELELPEGKVLEKLNAVSTAKRQAYVELHDSGFGKREAVHRAKRAGRKA